MFSAVKERAAGGTRFDPMSGNWAMTLIDLVVVVALACAALGLSHTLSPSASTRWLIFISATSFLILVFVAWPLRFLLRKQRADSDAVNHALRLQSDRKEFDARLGRALEMADAEPVALTIAARALNMCADEISASVLLADNSDAHLQTVITTEGCAPEGTCDVATPRGCPAVRIGHTLEFADSDQLDSCPHLRDRGIPSLAALCVPVSVVGRATGVVHAVRRERSFDAAERARIETVARQSGQRVGMLRATEQAQLQASTDPLTGLNNRRSMENSVRQLVHEDAPYAVTICDLDHFKVLNDTYGHDTGDRALRLFARTLRNTVRAGDLVSRHGGEEFVVVLPFADADAAAAVMDRLRLELVAALSDGRTPSFTMSAGVADTTESCDYQELLGMADERLLEAKRSGRDRVLTRIT